VTIPPAVFRSDQDCFVICLFAILILVVIDFKDRGVRQGAFTGASAGLGDEAGIQPRGRLGFKVNKVKLN
jgi:hypothetical protein